MDEASTVGARIRVLRRWRRMSQQVVADRSGFSQAFLSQVERGQMALDRRSHIAGLARALRVSEADIVGGPHLSDDPVQSDPHMHIPALRLALQTSTVGRPAKDRARPLPELVAELSDTIEPRHRACDYAGTGQLLPDLIEQLDFHASSPKDERAYRLTLEALIEACSKAAALAKYVGYPDLAYVASNRAEQVAELLNDPIQRGKAAFSTVLNGPRTGGLESAMTAWERANLAAEHAANELEPHVTEPLGLQVLGMLTLTASLTAAAIKKHDSARYWLNEADSLARRTEDNPEHNWQGFSKTNVGIWKTTIAVERGEGGSKMLEIVKDVRQQMGYDKLSNYRARKSALYAEVGRGLAREKKTRDEAVNWLRNAENLAPQRIRNSASVRHTVEVLHGQALAAAVGLELRGMMARMGIPH